MSSMSLKDKALAAIVGMVALYLVAVAMWFMHSESAWKKAVRKYESAKANYQKECKLIAEKKRWFDAYEKEKAAMPMFEEGKSTDTTWLKKMDAIAAKNLVLIGQRQSKEEVSGGDVTELPIEVRAWEGSLEALVKFLYELENTEEGMFDMKDLNFKPSSKKGYLRGSFTLNCAYMREK